MEHRTIYWTPVYMTATWFTLVRLQLSNYTLVVLVQFKNREFPISLSQLQYHLIEFQTAFLNARLDIPIESKPILLRQFARREVLLLLYLHTKTGAVVFPRPRPLPESQIKEVYSIFWSLFGECKSLLSIQGTRDITVCRDYYRFYAEIDTDYELFLLFTAEGVNPDQLVTHVSEVLANLHRQT
ncbi:hypothetical protein HMI54_012949 [Coelomomyces lativittatus]|nr:hypothetical protein HMI54_012949 [Coelomomyces lativittatus]KAJ1501540.1 hypothetical protein HMI56_003183 [Coelomomyces lativittatus]